MVRGDSHKQDEFEVQYLRNPSRNKEYIRVHNNQTNITEYIPMSLIEKVREDQWALEETLRGKY